MFGSTIIEVAMGLIFVYFLLSVICTNINDYVARILRWRSKDLHDGIRTLLNDPELTNQVWNHALVRSMGGPKAKDPAWIPPNTFALALFDALAPPAGQPSGLQSVRQTATALPDGSARDAIVSMIDAADGKMADARKGVEEWFNRAMDQVSTAYRQRMQGLALLVAALVTILFGADTIALANTLYREPALRAAVAGAAQNTQTTVSGTPASKPSDNVQGAVAEISKLNLPLGWNELPKDASGWTQKIFGLLLTTLAASLGAPFWYDLLKNLSSLFQRKA
ncbi:MAG: hypothetical protein HZC40_10650 [Chloroflexi bacterium]|nr:hypothetical protein [Chloroflexota bacterium]